MNSNPNNPHGNQNLLRRLASTQYQSYTTALTVTIAVGCFLLLLNIIIFAGIYYQREKRANDAKRKEELTEVENHCSSSTSLDKCSKTSRKSSLQSVAGFTGQSGNFGEYNCYDEKLKMNEKRALADICSVELPMKEFDCSPTGESITDSLCKETFKNTVLNRSQDNLVLYPPTYNSPPLSTSDPCSSKGGNSTNHFHHHHSHHHQMTLNNSSKLVSSTSATVTNQQPQHHHHHFIPPLPQPEQCNQSTQSEQPSSQDVGTTVDENDVELQNVGIPEPPPPPRSTVPFQGGILRGGPTTPGTTKKRVQIQEISV